MPSNSAVTLHKKKYQDSCKELLQVSTCESFQHLSDHELSLSTHHLISPDMSTLQTEFNKPRGEQGPTWTHTYNITVNQFPNPVSTVYWFHHFFRTANLRHLVWYSGSQFSDFSIGPRSKASGNTLNGKSWERKHGGNEIQPEFPCFHDSFNKQIKLRIEGRK